MRKERSPPPYSWRWGIRLQRHMAALPRGTFRSAAFQRMIGRRVGMVGYRTDDALRFASYHLLKRVPFRIGIGRHGIPDT